MSRKFTIQKYTKDFIREHDEMNTSAGVFPELDAHIQWVIGKSIELAKYDGRKTVMDRDIRYALKAYVESVTPCEKPNDKSV